MSMQTLLQQQQLLVAITDENKIIFSKSRNIGFIEGNILYVKKDFAPGAKFNNVIIDSELRIVQEFFKIPEMKVYDPEASEVIAQPSVTNFEKAIAETAEKAATGEVVLSVQEQLIVKMKKLVADMEKCEKFIDATKLMDAFSEVINQAGDISEPYVEQMNFLIMRKFSKELAWSKSTMEINDLGKSIAEATDKAEAKKALDEIAKICIDLYGGDDLFIKWQKLYNDKYPGAIPSATETEKEKSFTPVNVNDLDFSAKKKLEISALVDKFRSAGTKGVATRFMNMIIEATHKQGKNGTIVKDEIMKEFNLKYGKK